MKKVLYILAIAVLSIIIALNICSLCDVSLFGYRVFKIATGSMEPYLKVNDIVLIKKSNKYGVSDVITYKYNNSYITHRIMSSEGDEIVTKGDANNTTDEPIKKSDVVGKVIFKLQIMTYISYLISNPFIWGIAIVICGILIIVLPNHKKKNGKIIDEEVI